MKTLTRLILSILWVGIFAGCNQEESPPVEPLPTKVGDAYQGGIVFFIDSSGKHGLIASKADQSRSVVWWNGSLVDTGATSLTDGSSNTDLIIDSQGNGAEYAAKLCRDLRDGGFSDWHLASKDELNLLHTQKNLVENFAENIYWSSSQYDVGQIWVQDFGTGEQHLDSSSDGANVAVRAVRAY